MKKETKEKLDKLARKDKIKNIGVFIFVVLFFVGFMVVLIPFFTVDSTKIEGTVFQLTAVPTDEGNLPIIMVKLKDGEIVRAHIPSNTPFKKDAKVELNKSEKVGGFSTYKFIRYVE